MAAIPVDTVNGIGRVAPIDGATGLFCWQWLRWFQQLQVVSSTIPDVQAEILALQSGLASTNGVVALLGVRMTAAEANIAANGTAIAGLQVLTGALQITVNQHTLQINTLDAEVAALQEYPGFLSVQTVTAAATFARAVNTILADATSAGFAVKLTLSPVEGEVHNLKKIDSTLHVVTLDGNGKNIDGVASIDLLLPEWSLAVVYDGAAWQIL